MKPIILATAMLLVGCSPSNRKSQNIPITRDEAIAIAIDANVMEYDQAEQIQVEVINDFYIVTFPMNLEPGVRGPDYAARIWIDAKTGKIVKHLSGS